MRNLSRIVIIFLFALIIITPGILYGVNQTTSKQVDVPLNGVTNEATMAELSTENVLDGSFQNSFNTWLDNNVPLRGVIIRTYATINYNLFRTGTRIIGRDGDIFESIYINSSIGLGAENDFTNSANVASMQEYVDTLVALDNRLQELDKQLFIVIVPDKGKFNFENIPLRFRMEYDEDRMLAGTLFHQMTDETNLPILYAYDYRDAIGYPLYYTTGIHWSRPYEQFISRQIILELNELTGRSYRAPILGDAVYSSTPFWRDSDIYDIQNTWIPATGDYYEFEMSRSYPEYFDEMHALVCCDSFGLGFHHDMSEVYEDEDMTFLFYDNYTINLHGEMYNVNNDYSTLDLQSIMDSTDVVIIEMNESNIVRFEGQFPSILNNFLETYVPESESVSSVNNFDGSAPVEWANTNSYGFYGYEAGYSWCDTEMAITLQNEQIYNSGLEVVINVPEGIAAAVGNNHMILYVNGYLVSEFDLVPGVNNITINPDELSSDDTGRCDIRIYSDKIYNPSEMGGGDDTRDLSYQLVYLGEVRQ